MTLSVHDIAVAEGAKPEATGGMRGDQYASRGLPLIAGCEGCGATLAPYNAYPSVSGYTRCSDCIGDTGFDTIADWHATYPPTPNRRHRP